MTLYIFYSFLLSGLVAFATASKSVIYRDVLVIGGGSSGTYTAIRLQQEGKSVALVEKEAILGGHTNTYIDPVTGTPIDHGVQAFLNFTVVRDYFQHLGVDYNNPDYAAGASGPSYTADYTANQIVLTSSLPQPDLGTLLPLYLAQLQKYPFLNQGFDLPTPIPADLLLPFGSFLEKYELQGLAGLFFSYAQGMGNLLAQPSLYVMKLMHDGTIDAILQGTFLVTVGNGNVQIYQKALQILGANVYLNSTATSISRSKDGVTAKISTPSGHVTVHAKKLVCIVAQFDMSLTDKTGH
jgi:hypothetical protein